MLWSSLESIEKAVAERVAELNRELEQRPRGGACQPITLSIQLALKESYDKTVVM
jgi:hypothetical protein